MNLWMTPLLSCSHEKALEGITVCGEIRGRDRFVPIIMGLGMRDNQPMQVACIQLVNAIVSTPDDLDFRLHLRNEIMRTGLIDLIGVCGCHVMSNRDFAVSNYNFSYIGTTISSFVWHKVEIWSIISLEWSYNRTWYEHSIISLCIDNSHIFNITKATVKYDQVDSETVMKISTCTVALTLAWN